MKQSSWSYKHCINDYYGNNGGENCQYYEEPNNVIIVKHENGYYGKLYGKSSLSIYRGDKEVFHTVFRSINTTYELYELLTEIPTFMKKFI